MRRFGVLFLLLGVLALPAWPQTAQELPRFDATGGFTHVTSDVGYNGWELGASYRPQRWLGIVADFSGGYGSSDVFGISFNSNLYTFMFGPRIYVPVRRYPRWKPFGQALFGWSRINQTVNESIAPGGAIVPSSSDTDTAFSWTLGGGVDYQFARDWRVRVVQAELFRTNNFDDGDTRFRIGFGLVYQFGGR